MVSIKVVIVHVFPVMAGHPVCAAAQQYVRMPSGLNQASATQWSQMSHISVFLQYTLQAVCIFDMHMWSMQQVFVVFCWSSHTVSCPACR